VQQANIEAQRARVTAKAGPALYPAKLFDSNDTEAMVKLITALLVLVLDPLVAPDDRRRGFFRAASIASGL
jgi:hypothetical protein